MHHYETYIRSAMASSSSSSTTIEAVYPVKEEGETNHEYKIACDIAYRRTNVLRLSVGVKLSDTPSGRRTLFRACATKPGKEWENNKT
jgi:hypothetical protein